MKSTHLTPARSAILDQVTTLSFEEALTGDYCIIDVRSPKEFQEGSLPDAINIPIFDNDERSMIGTLYRVGGQADAVVKGFELVEGRIGDFLARFKVHGHKELAVFCARGGMRSRSVVNLLNQHGIKAFQLYGGFKQYRHLLLAKLEQFKPQCIVLHGHTGTGKTRLLQLLEPMIDLEDLAQHQSSLFGGMNRIPRTQKSFDSYLHQAICRLPNGPFFIEGESRKLGNVFLPRGLAEAMKQGRLILITAQLETRVARIVEDYPVSDDTTRDVVIQILKSLKSKLGSAVTEKLCTLLKQGELAELVRILLVEYYDKRYDNSFRHYSFDLTVSSEDLQDAARILQEYRSTLVC